MSRSIVCSRDLVARDLVGSGKQVSMREGRMALKKDINLLSCLQCETSPMRSYCNQNRPLISPDEAYRLHYVSTLPTSNQLAWYSELRDCPGKHTV